MPSLKWEQHRRWRPDPESIVRVTMRRWWELNEEKNGRVIMCETSIVILVERAMAGDRRAYGELIERFQPTVYALALSRLRNPGEAQELAQEVFIHSMTRLGQLRDPRCFAGWLRQITVRMALNRLARRG